MTALRILAETHVPLDVEGLDFTVAAVAPALGAACVSVQLFHGDDSPYAQHTLSPAAAHRLALTIRSVVRATSEKMERAAGEGIDAAPVHTASLGALGRARVGVIHDNGRYLVGVETEQSAPKYAVLAPLESAGVLIQALDQMAAVAAGQREGLELPM